METLQTLSSFRGRAIVRDVFRELRYERQNGALASLVACWRICTTEKDLHRSTRHEVTVSYPLGILGGTRLWLEEIVHRFFYSAVNSFVYLGAALLLSLVALYRFTETLSSNAVIAAVLIEAALLVLLFILMFFSPPESPEMETGASAEPESELQELVREIGEISTDYATVSSQMDDVVNALSSMVVRQEEMIEVVRKLADATHKAVSPQPEMLSAMAETTNELRTFTAVVHSLKEASHSLRRAEVERAVQREVERIISRAASEIDSGDNA